MARINAGASAREGLYSTPSRRLGEAALQTFKEGAVLIASGGYLSEGGANPSNIIGVAMEDGENNATAGAKTCGYVPALPHVLFVMSMSQASNLGARATVVTDRFSKFGITKDADGKWYVDADKNGANQKVVVVDFVDDVGTVEGRVLVAFLGSQTIYTI